MLVGPGWKVVMDVMGFGGAFRNYLKAIYNDPQAKVYSPGFLSDKIDLRKGTRQGCPLSPVLFNIALEPLIQLLLQTGVYDGIKVGRTEIKLACFADHLLLYLQSPEKHLKWVLDILEHYGKATGYKINVSKSQILFLHPVRPDTSHQYEVEVRHNYIMYLGIKIWRTSQSIYSLNYPPLIQKIERARKMERLTPIP